MNNIYFANRGYYIRICWIYRSNASAIYIQRVGYICSTRWAYMSNTHGIYSLQVTDKQRYSTRLFALSNATLIFGQIFSFPSNS